MVVLPGSALTRLLAPLGVLTLMTGIAAWILLPGVPPLPAIQGAWLLPAKPLPHFKLERHNGESVTPDTLTGSWHLISYGFTYCPDICPTTLAELARFKRSLEQQARFTDLEIHFYTVDPDRDSLTQLSEYLPWFHDQFIGWRAGSEQQAERFESALGIHSNVSRDAQGSVQVTHGLKLFVLNSEGRLQAVLEPTLTLTGRLHFEPDRLLQDYLTLRRWVSYNGTVDQPDP
jgi:protein SCO1/2